MAEPGGTGSSLLVFFARNRMEPVPQTRVEPDPLGQLCVGSGMDLDWIRVGTNGDLLGSFVLATVACAFSEFGMQW